MSLQTPTWLQASGYRFLLRRLECALLGGDPRSVSGDLRAPAASLACGCAVAMVAVLGCAFLALLRPQPGVGDRQIVMGNPSGALYVRVGDVWHPVLNLASARLIASMDANPATVPDAELARLEHGAVVGIPGAPQSVAVPLPAGESNWTICDGPHGEATTVFIGPVTDSSLRRVQPEHALLATPGSGSPTYLLYRGRRAIVDLADPGLRRALGLTGQVPQLVPQSLLNAVPEAAPLTAPRIRAAGAPAGTWLPGSSVGNVLRIPRATSDEYYVVLDAGLQRIGRFTADLLRFQGSRDSRGSRDEVIVVTPETIRAAPLVDTLPVAGLPDEAPADVSAAATVCAAWAGPADIAILTGSGAPPARSVTLAQADGPGPALDAVRLPPGRSAYVVAQSLSGGGPPSGARYLVTETGVRFPIHDDDAARSLGLPAAAAPAPWPLLAALPCGPGLSREQASVARDTIAAGPP